MSLSNDDDEILSKWPPKSIICVINNTLLAEVTDYQEDINQEDDFDHYLYQITSLDLHLRDGSKGKIRKIEQLHKLPNLLQLNLSYNALVTIEGLESLLHLEELNLAENSLTSMEGIFHLKDLKRLNICGNMIERIPSDICSLRQLEALRLNRNRLHVVNDLNHLKEMRSLKYLRIDNNMFPSQDVEGTGLRRLILQKVTPSLDILDNVNVTDEERY